MSLSIWLLMASFLFGMTSSCVESGQSALCLGVGPTTPTPKPGVTFVRIRTNWWSPTRAVLMKFFPDLKVRY